MKELERFLLFMRPAFSRQATLGWFVLVFVGFICHSDTYGASSIVRALSLMPESYTCPIAFFPFDRVECRNTHGALVAVAG